MFVYFFVVGLLFGSFYNVCIYRLPEGKSVVKPRSACGHCDHVLGPLDLIPVLSYVLHGGKCRYCGQKYSPRYALVELLTGLLFVLSYQAFGLSLDLIFALVLASVVIIVTFIDIDHHIILDRFSVIIILTAFIYHVLEREQSLLSILLGGLVGFVFLYIIAIFGAMGGGDIKILGSYGLLIGFPNIILTIYLSFLIGAIFFTPQLIRKKVFKKEISSEVPFGPFLSIGAFITFVYGHQIIDLYLSTIY